MKKIFYLLLAICYSGIAQQRMVIEMMDYSKIKANLQDIQNTYFIKSEGEKECYEIS